VQGAIYCKNIDVREGVGRCVAADFGRKSGSFRTVPDYTLHLEEPDLVRLLDLFGTWVD